MRAVWTPFTFLVAVLTGWLNERQARILEFLQEENRILRRRLGKKRLRLTDDERGPAARHDILNILFEFSTGPSPPTRR